MNADDYGNEREGCGDDHDDDDDDDDDDDRDDDYSVDDDDDSDADGGTYVPCIYSAHTLGGGCCR